MLSRFSVIVLTFVISAGLCVLAPAPSEAADEALARGASLYRKGNFNDAYAILKNALPSMEQDADRAEAHIILAMIHLAQDRLELAEAEFGEAVTYDPKRTLSQAKYPPDVIRLYDQARARSLGAIIVQTDPSDADVYVDGKLVGLTPVPVDNLLAGRHMVSITKEGYRTEEREIEVSPSERTEFYLELSVADDTPASIAHQPVTATKEGSTFRVKARIQDNRGVAEAKLHLRSAGSAEYEQVDMYQIEESIYEGVAPRDKVTIDGLEYYITARDVGGNTTFEGKPEAPFIVKVEELDKEPPRLFHTPISVSSDASKLVIKAKALDNKFVDYVKLHYRKGGEKRYIEERMREEEEGSGDYSTLIPEVFMSARNLEYYLEAADDSGNVQYSGRADSPIKIRMIRTLPYKDGYIVDREKKGDRWGKEVTVNVGTLKGYRKDQVFTVFTASDRVIDPETGMVLKINQELTGKIKIVSPGPASSRARIIREYGRDAIRKGDLIRLRPSPPTGVGGYSEKFRQITVTWNVNPEPEVKGYMVYRSDSPEGPFEEFKKVSSRTIEVVDKGSRKHKLEDGKKYYYRVRAFNDEKELSDFSETGLVVAKGGPNPPSAVSASSGLIRNIPLSWGPSADKEAAGYKVFRSAREDGEYEQIADIKSSSSTGYVDESEPEEGNELADGRTYWYKLASYNKKGKVGNMTEPVSASTRARPEPVANLRVVSTALRSVSIAWDRSSDPDVTEYRVYRNTAPEGDFGMIKEITDRNVTEYIDSDKSGKDIKDGQTYYYRVTAVNKGGVESGFSSAVSGATFGPPPAPSSVRARSGLVKQVTLEWEPLRDKSEVTGYVIYRGLSPDDMKEVKRIIGREKSSFKDTGSWNDRLEDGATYYYTVKSVNTVGVESANTGAIPATTKPVPVAPTGLTATQGQVGGTTISWAENPELDIESYRISRSTSRDGGFQTIASVSGTRHEDVGLKNGKTYYYYIEAIDKDNLVGEKSETIAVITKPLPEAPARLDASPGATSVALSWTPSVSRDVDHYEIYSVGFFGKQKIGQSEKPEFLVENLKPDTSYSFVVTAVDGEGLTSEPTPPVQSRTSK